MEKAKSATTCGPHNGGDAGGGLVSYLSLGGMILTAQRGGEKSPECFKSDGQLSHYLFLHRNQLAPKHAQDVLIHK